MFSRTSKTESTAISTHATSGSRKGVPSVISSDLHILGNLVSEGLVDVDGSIEGNIKGDQITVRSNGKIRGDVVAQVVHVYGEVHGLIRAHSVHLYSSCHVEGVIMHQSLTVEDGAFIDGKFKRLQDNKLGGEERTDIGEDEDSGIIETSPAAPLTGNLRLIG